MATEIDTLFKEIQDARAFVQERIAQGVAPLKEEQERLAKTLLEVQTGFKQLQRDKLARMDNGKVRVRDGRLAGLDLFDLRILREVMGRRVASGKSGKALLEEVMTQQRNVAEFLTQDHILEWEDAAIQRRSVMGAGQAPQRALADFRGSISGWTRGMIAQYQRALDSTTAAKGDELVPTFEAAELWMDVNLDTLVLPLVPQIAMPTNPFDIPVQFGDTNWYPSTENVQVTTTDPSTGKATLTAYGVKTGVPFSDELEEDSIIAFIPELRSNLVRNAAEVIDDVLLNGDTTVTNNINADGATIAKSTAGKAQWLLGFDGLIHLPIVDNTGQAVNKAAAVDADVYNQILAKLARFAVPRRRGEVVYVTDVNTATRSLSIAEFETLDVAGLRATLATGEIING